MAGKPKHAVMVSSTYKELVDHRRAIEQAVLGQELFPVAMENDAALPDHDLISASLAKVDEADAYVGLISYRYGQAPQDTDRNPNNWSLTELEFRRALDRKIPICMFIMHHEHLVPRSAVGAEGDLERAKLSAFIALARKDRIYAEFKSVDDLRAKAVQSLVKLREVIERRAASFSPAGMAEPTPGLLDISAGWEIIDQDRIAKIRANPPLPNSMIQFFDGILPTWQLALAQGVRPRAIVERLKARFSVIHHGATKPQVVLLAGAGGEGKSTAVLHTVAALVEDTQQQWKCLFRQAANAELAEDALAKLPITPNGAWIVAIDDADNIGPSILAAVRMVASRTDVHLLLSAREAEWHVKRLVPGVWQPASDFHAEPLTGLDQEDARRIVAGWVAWGDNAMGQLKGQSEGDAVAALLGHARDFATRGEDGELLGALLATRQGADMRAHVRALVNGLDREPVINSFSLRDAYILVASMHAENQLYLSRSVLAFAIGCEVDELERKILRPLRREAMLDSGDSYVLTRHRRIAEAACALLREEGEDIDQKYSFLAKAALKHFHRKRPTLEIASWRFALAKHFVDGGQDRWPVAASVASAVWSADGSNVQTLTALASVLRRVGRAPDAMALLKSESGRFRTHRGVLQEWGTVAGAIDDQGLSSWLDGRALADGGEPPTPYQWKGTIAGLGVAFRELFATSQDKLFAIAQTACGQLGLRLKEMDTVTRRNFERHVAFGRELGIADLSLEQAVDAIRKAVILGANHAEPANDPAFFEKLLGEPDGYRYMALLRLVAET